MKTIFKFDLILSFGVQLLRENFIYLIYSKIIIPTLNKMDITQLCNPRYFNEFTIIATF